MAGMGPTTGKAGDLDNLDRLFNWMSNVASGDEGDDGVQVGADGGPVITTLGHVRELAKLIEDPKALERLDDTRSMQEATLSSGLSTEAEVKRAFGACDDGVQRLNKQIRDLDDDDLDHVEQLIGQLHGIAFSHKRRPAASGERLPWQPFNEWPQCQFSTVRIGEYRGVDGLVLEDLRRINVIAGVNNAGKTSVLEAIHLLAHQNDEMALLDALRWRGRFDGEPGPKWLVDQMQPRIDVAGNFDRLPDHPQGRDRPRRLGDAAQRHVPPLRTSRLRPHRGQGHQPPRRRSDEGLPRLKDGPPTAWSSSSLRQAAAPRSPAAPGHQPQLLRLAGGQSSPTPS